MFVGKKNALLCALSIFYKEVKGYEVAGGDDGSVGANNFRVAIGQNAEATMNANIAIGFDAEAKTGIDAVAVGNQARANKFSVAIGQTAQSMGENSVGVGLGTRANSNNAVAVGNGATVSGVLGTSCGTGAMAASLGSAYGVGANAGQSSVAVGEGSDASTGFAVAIGQLARVVAAGADGAGNAIAIGPTSEATFPSAIAIGRAAAARFFNAIAIGDTATVLSDTSIAIGGQSFTSGANSVVIGYQTRTTQNLAMLLGGDGTNGFKYNVGIGTSTPNVGASLDLGSDDRALVLNRVNVATTALVGIEGMIVFDPTADQVTAHNGIEWLPVGRQELSLDSSSSTLTLTDANVDETLSTVDLSSVTGASTIQASSKIESQSCGGTAGTRLYYENDGEQNVTGETERGRICPAKVQYGPAATGGIVVIKDGELTGLGAVLNQVVKFGSITVRLKVNDEFVGNSIVFGSGDGKSGVATFTPVPVQSGDLIEFSVSYAKSTHPVINAVSLTALLKQ